MASYDTFAALNAAIDSTPLIDNHCHNLLKPTHRDKVPLLSIASEAQGEQALNDSKTSLAHIRATKHLAQALGCEQSWEAVESAVEKKRSDDTDDWMKRCFQGIETLLLDDGFGGDSEIQQYSWHDPFVKSSCKRIVRIEALASSLFKKAFQDDIPSAQPHTILKQVLDNFKDEINRSIADRDVVGFKSIICYRGGLDIPPSVDVLSVTVENAFHSVSHLYGVNFNPLRHPELLLLNQALVHITAQLISESADIHQPIQFHTGLGDNEITLTKSSPAYLQGFIIEYPKVPIVLLHSSYPWTREAGYLATMYPNVYADIGEVFPYLNRDGQVGILKQVLELTPWSKVLLSTDGHSHAEMYLIATTQIRSVLKTVIGEHVANRQLAEIQAIQLVQDVLFNNSNELYDLGLKPLESKLYSGSVRSVGEDHPDGGNKFYNDNSGTELDQSTHARIKKTSLCDNLMYHINTLKCKWLRVCWQDYTSSTRCRLVPLRRILDLVRRGKSLDISITAAALGLLQTDMIIPNVTSSGMYSGQVDLFNTRRGPAPGHISVFAELRNDDGSESHLCPKTLLRKSIETANSHGLEFLLGFELEFVIMERNPDRNSSKRFITMQNDGHAWSMSRVLADIGREGSFNSTIDEILDALTEAGIDIEMFHPENALGQYEIVLPPKPPMEACEELLYTRQIVESIAARYGFRMTLHPKPFPMNCGTASHMHMSISSPHGDKKEIFEPFYAGILKHFPALIAFTYSNPASYERMVDSAWAGGRWVTWGTQNKEAPLRKCKDSHWEIRTIDGLANPYFVIAAIIAAGTNGFVSKEKLKWADSLGDPAKMSDTERKKLGITTMFPKDLREALTTLKVDEELCALLGEEFVQRYVDVKTAELELLEPMGAEVKRRWILERY